MHMFPSNPPQFPEAFGEMMANDPGPFMEMMESSMGSFGNAFQDGGMEAGGEAFMNNCMDAIGNGDVPGLSPEMFQEVADGFAECAGPALMGMDGDMGPEGLQEMGECFGEACEIMMPEGMDMHGDCGGMFENMAETCGDCGCGPHDLGNEFGPEMPEGFVAGDPGTYPEGDYMGPPDDGVEGDGDGEGMDALGGALGGEAGAGAGAEMADAGAAVDAAVGQAMDGAMAQGGPAGNAPAFAGDAAADTSAGMPDELEQQDDSPDDDGGGLG